MGGYNFMGAIMGKPRVLNNYSEANGLLIINKIRNDQPISNDSKIVVQLSSVVLAAFVVEVLFVVFEVAAVAVAVAPIMESETELENLCNHRTIIWGGGG